MGSFQPAPRSPEPAPPVGGAGGVPYYPWVDVLRGVSWILVVIAHCGIPNVGYLGRVGVGIFFAISGWLITGIVLREREYNLTSLTRFYTRRCLRILPLYYLLIAVLCVASSCTLAWKTAIAPGPGWDQHREHNFLRFLLTFSAEYWRGGSPGAFLGHCWSLCVEERFYVFWPLLLFLCPRHYLARCTLIALVTAVWYVVVARLPLTPAAGLMDAQTIALFALPFPLLLGSALAIALPKRLPALPDYVALPGCALCVYGYCWYASYTERLAGPALCTFALIPGLFAAGIVLFAVCCTAAPRGVLARLLQELGKLSYAAYLFHIPFVCIGAKVGGLTGNPWGGVVLAVTLSAGLAYAVHRWVERPILERRARVERAAWRRSLCAALQVAPIVAGLLLYLPKGQGLWVAAAVGACIGLLVCGRLALWAAAAVARRAGFAGLPSAPASRRDEGEASPRVAA